MQMMKLPIFGIVRFDNFDIFCLCKSVKVELSDKGGEIGVFKVLR